MQPLDLSKAPPRGPYEQLAGLFMLPRTIDKLRAELPGGNLGTYHFSGFSETLLEDLEVHHDALLDVVASAKNDDEVVAWILAECDDSMFPALNEKMLARKLDESNRERLTNKYPVIADHPEVSKLFDVLVLDDTTQFATPAS